MTTFTTTATKIKEIRDNADTRIRGIQEMDRACKPLMEILSQPGFREYLVSEPQIKGDTNLYLWFQLYGDCPWAEPFGAALDIVRSDKITCNGIGMEEALRLSKYINKPEDIPRAIHELSKRSENDSAMGERDHIWGDRKGNIVTTLTFLRYVLTCSK
jgi:hypothetical protein